MNIIIHVLYKIPKYIILSIKQYNIYSIMTKLCFAVNYIFIELCAFYICTINTFYLVIMVKKKMNQNLIF